MRFLHDHTRNELRKDKHDDNVILSGAPRESMLHLRDGRAVEEPVLSLPKESRGCVACDVASGSSTKAVSCERPGAAFKNNAWSRSFDSPQSQSSLGFAQDDTRWSLRRHQKHSREIYKLAPLTLFFMLTLCITNPLPSTHADTRPAVQLNVEHAFPREVNETVQQAVVRDYASAWQALENALATNNAAGLYDSFVGFAQEQVTLRVQEQQKAGLKTRIVDRGHEVEAIFYSPEGAAIELRDTATLETQILDGETVVHSEQARVQYYAILTGAEDRWKVRVLESANGREHR